MTEHYTCRHCGETILTTPIWMNESPLCESYPSRPLLCRIDESYDYFFKDSMTREEFYRANLQVCSKLKTKRT